MFEMLTGKPPFVRAGPPRCSSPTWSRNRRGSGSAIDCPVWLENLVLKLLEKDPEDRYDALALQVARRGRTEGRRATSVAQQTIAGGGSATVKEDAAAANGPRQKKKKKKKRSVRLRTGLVPGELPGRAGGVHRLVLLADERRAAFDAAMRVTESQRSGHGARAVIESCWKDLPQGTLARRRANSRPDRHGRGGTTGTDVLKLHQDPPSEAARLFIDALRFEQFKDRITAIRSTAA